VTDLSNEQLQLLAAATLQVLKEFNQTSFAGDVKNLVVAVERERSGDFNGRDVIASLGVLEHLGGVTRSQQGGTAEFIRLDTGIVSARFARANDQRFNARKVNPLLFEYDRFGGDWLDRIWPDFFSQADATVQPSEMAPADEPQVTTNYESSSWTGLPSDFLLTEDKRAAIVRGLDVAADSLQDTSASQHDQAQARAYIISAKALLEAPEPDPDLAWQLIGRANNLAGIAALFVSIIALFVTH
jgi:hypothetical protein